MSCGLTPFEVAFIALRKINWDVFVCLPSETALIDFSVFLIKQNATRKSTTEYQMGGRTIWVGLHVDETTLSTLRCYFGVIWVGEFLCDDVDEIPRGVFIVDDGNTPRDTHTSRPLTYPCKVVWIPSGMNVGANAKSTPETNFDAEAAVTQTSAV